jgi:hypothetical protein
MAATCVCGWKILTLKTANDYCSAAATVGGRRCLVHERLCMPSSLSFEIEKCTRLPRVCLVDWIVVLQVDGELARCLVRMIRLPVPPPFWFLCQPESKRPSFFRSEDGGLKEENQHSLYSMACIIHSRSITGKGHSALRQIAMVNLQYSRWLVRFGIARLDWTAKVRIAGRSGEDGLDGLDGLEKITRGIFNTDILCRSCPLGS